MRPDSTDRLSRSDLALALQAATALQAARSDEETVPVAEAERVAAEVGIDPATFRAAVRVVRSSRIGVPGLFGFRASLSGETRMNGSVTAGQAARMLTQAHLSLPVPGVLEEPAPNTWRSTDRTTLLQVTSMGGETSVGAVVDRRMAKVGIVSGGIGLGAVAGMLILPGVTLAAGGSVAALALANVAGVLGGAGTGFLAGRAAWNATARRTHDRVVAALERMRDVANGSEPTGQDLPDRSGA